MKDLFPGEDLFVLACLWVLACGLAWGASGLGLGLDFFYDEVWSLTNYVFVSPWATVSQLPVPNNHIFWNLLVNFWTKLFGLDLATVLRPIRYTRKLAYVLGSGSTCAPSEWNATRP